jgi:hypothetical protein
MYAQQENHRVLSFSLNSLITVLKSCCFSKESTWKIRPSGVSTFPEVHETNSQEKIMLIDREQLKLLHHTSIQSTNSQKFLTTLFVRNFCPMLTLTETEAKLKNSAAN